MRNSDDVLEDLREEFRGSARAQLPLEWRLPKKGKSCQGRVDFNGSMQMSKTGILECLFINLKRATLNFILISQSFTDSSYALTGLISSVLTQTILNRHNDNNWTTFLKSTPLTKLNHSKFRCSACAIVLC